MIWAKVKNIIGVKTLAKTKAKFNPVLHTSSYTIYCGYELDDLDQIVEDVVIAYSSQISPYLNCLEGTNVITYFYPNNNYRIYYFLYINDGTSNQLTQLVYSYEVSTIQKEIHPLVDFYIQDETSFLITFGFDAKQLNMNLLELKVVDLEDNLLASFTDLNSSNECYNEIWWKMPLRGLLMQLF